MSIYFRRSYQRAFGTFPLTGDALLSAVEAALEVGYRAFDTAQMYGNEADVGEALAAGGAARADLCVTTKVHPDNFASARFIPSVEESLKKLRLDKVDVLLVHWPPADGIIAPTLHLLQEALQRGLTNAIGISNYNAAMMREARRIVDAPLVTNQVEFHPLLNQGVLLAAAAETGIPLASYCSLARGEVFRHALFAEIGAEYEVTAGQVALRWILQKGVSLNTMSTRRENMRMNFDLMDFTLSSVHMARIDALTRTNYRILTEDRVPWAPRWD